MKKITGFVSVTLVLCMLLSFTACDTAEPIDEPQETAVQTDEPHNTQEAVSTPAPKDAPFIISRAGMFEDKFSIWEDIEIGDRVFMGDKSHTIIMSTDPKFKAPAEHMNLSEEYREMVVQALEKEDTLFCIEITLTEPENAFLYEGLTIQEWREDEEHTQSEKDAAIAAYNDHLTELLTNEVLRLRGLGYNVWFAYSHTSMGNKYYSIRGLLSHDEIVNFLPSEDIPECEYYMELF